jgi:hypothetical protein
MYEDKFIAFVDILGFSDLVRQSEEKTEGSLSVEELLVLTEKLGTSEGEARFAKSGPVVCPCSPYISKDLGFQITQVSDCVVVSTEVSPAAIINLVQHCFGVSISLLMAGYLCRGFITRGKIFHKNGQFIGSGYMKAVDGEKRVSIFQLDSAERGTPFIQIDPTICQYVDEQDDACVKTQFTRMTESDGHETGISPFGALKRMPSTVIDSNFDPLKWKGSIQVMRDHMQRLMTQLEKAEIRASESGREKIAHYKRKIGEVLAVKDREIELMDKLAGRVPRPAEE